MDASDLIVAYLESIGVEHVFGIPGGAVEPLYNAMARSERRGGLRHVLARHESGAAFMADGYARETGRLGVCVATSGPGATNLLTGVACAHDNGVPMLVITGQPPLPSFGKGALQESACTGINTVGMFRHCTRYNSLVSHPEQLEHKLVSALMQAYQMPQGPAHLSIPLDVLRSPIDRAPQAYDLNSLLMRKADLVDEAAVRRLAAELGQVRRPVFLIGGGCGDAIEEVLALVELTDAQFLCTPDGKGFINPRHRRFRGVFGFGGHASAEAVLRSEPELVLAFGTRLGEWNSGGWCEAVLNSRMVHIDSCDENLMRSPMARMHLHGRLKAVCERLVQVVRETATARPAVPIKSEQQDPQAMLQAPEMFNSDAGPIKPQRLMRELSERCPANTRFVADTGNSTAWAVHYLQPHDRRLLRVGQPVSEAANERRSGTASWLRVTMDFAPMGWAIGASIGIARANPRCPVVCITGDGSYLMNGQEITVAAQEQLPVVFVVLNDRALGMVRHGQRLAGAESIGHQLPAVDFRLMAAAMDIPGFVIRSPEDFEQLDFAAVLRRKGPTLLDVRVDPDEVPPLNVRMKALRAAP
ncbi:MAG: thiamine pyrophosphate-binding protein [Burkholderiales bacterium]|nr:thiamine pyrophosphate-binding protein [Burkholderiales bacterium]